jgi:hypothetical protein
MRAAYFANLRRVALALVFFSAIVQASCGDSIATENSSRAFQLWEHLQKQLRKIPYLTFSPLPHLEFQPNPERIDSARAKYSTHLLQGTQIPTPQTNEEKLGLLEAVRAHVDNSNIDQLPLFRRMFEERTRELTKLISEWKAEKGPITQVRIERYVDLLYAASNDDFFRIRKFVSWIHSPAKTYSAWVRLRWQSRIQRSTLKTAFEDLGLLHPSLAKGRLWGRVKTSLLLTANVFVNYQSTMFLGFPVWVPNLRVSRDSLDLPLRMARKLYPIFVAGAIAVLQFQVYEKFQHGFNHNSIPVIENLVTRESIEEILRTEHFRIFSETFQRSPDLQEQSAFNDFLAKARLQALLDLQAKLETNKNLPLEEFR